MWNASVFYERGPVNVRVAYTKRSDYLDEINADNPALDLYWEGRGQLDVTGSVQLAKGINLFAEGKNLTNTPGVRYFGSASGPTSMRNSATRYSGCAGEVVRGEGLFRLKSSPSPSGEGLGWGLAAEVTLAAAPHPGPSPEGEGRDHLLPSRFKRRAAGTEMGHRPLGPRPLHHCNICDCRPAHAWHQASVAT